MVLAGIYSRRVFPLMALNGPPAMSDLGALSGAFKAGSHLLPLSFSGLDPERTSATFPNF